MFTAASLQIIKDCIDVNRKGEDGDAAQAIADFCEANIKATCNKCGGDGMVDVVRDGITLKDFKICNECDGSGKGEDFDAIGGERRGDRVAPKSGVRSTVPGEGQGGFPVDHLSRAYGEPVVGHDASDRRVSLVAVLRSMVKYRRQPLRQYQVSVTQPEGFSRMYR